MKAMLAALATLARALARWPPHENVDDAANFVCAAR
jgi:hypothetical protein